MLKIIKTFILSNIFQNLFFQLNICSVEQKTAEYLEWLNKDLLNIVNEYLNKRAKTNYLFAKYLDNVFGVNSFYIFVKKYCVDYFLNAFYLFCSNASIKKLNLYDNDLHKFLFEKYEKKFNSNLVIKWQNKAGFLRKFLAILILFFMTIYLSLKDGITLKTKPKRFKLLRETLWGLYRFGNYFHDDFLVDNNLIKKNEFALFTRNIKCDTRQNACLDAKNSDYHHFYLHKQKISLKTLFVRIIPKYLLSIPILLLLMIKDEDFMFYLNMMFDFIISAIPYEKMFSNYQFDAELGHAYFSFTHAIESIICQSHKTKYFLMHWSDISVKTDVYLSSFLSCDKFFFWGDIHKHGVEGDPEIYENVGYPFKKFILEIKRNREQYLRSILEMEIRNPMIISFFDEAFGHGIKMTQENFIYFWQTISKVAEHFPDAIILVKPKGSYLLKNLDENAKKTFELIKDEINSLSNAFIVDDTKWSFIEIIGVSDIVVSQGMTSSSTIGLICGVDSFYLDQANYNHEFRKRYFNQIVFDNAEKLVEKISQVISKQFSCKEIMDKELLRKFDAFDDDKALERMRRIITDNIKKDYTKNPNILLIIQARIGSTRLPGKVIKKIGNLTILELIIKRVKMAKKINKIIVATTEKKDDDIIFEISKKNGIVCFRGSEEDVLSRYYYCAKAFKGDVIVRITADCPFIDPNLIDKAIELYFSSDVSYVSNTIYRTYPRGLDVEVFSFEALENAYNYAKENYQREHVTPYIYEYCRINQLIDSKDNSSLRVTVDTEEDYLLAKTVYENIKNKDNFSYLDVINTLKQDREILKINEKVKQKDLNH